MLELRKRFTQFSTLFGSCFLAVFLGKFRNAMLSETHTLYDDQFLEICLIMSKMWIAGNFAGECDGGGGCVSGTIIFSYSWLEKVGMCKWVFAECP